MPSGRGGILSAHPEELARQIVSGRIEVCETLQRIEEEVTAPLGHPAYLMGWCYLSSGLHSETLADLDGASLKEDVKTMAAGAAAEEETA